ncbi:hypothetical protein GA0115280_118753 [Streptomyces sp. Cmuel-A718b]|nr:hypothetical protein GA0115280_118753 [Streptomyces sp. Cmuel-A718b]
MRTKPYWTLFGVARGGCPTRRPTPPWGGMRASGAHLTPTRPSGRSGPRRGGAGCGLAWRGALLRCRLRRPPAPRRTPGAACRARRGLGRSRPSVPGGAAGPAAPGRGPGGGRGGRRVPPRRAGLHLVRDHGGARGNCRGSFRASACRPPSGPLGGRTLVGAPFGGGPRGGRRFVHRGPGGPVRGGGPGGVRGGAAGGHRAGLPPVGQPRGGYRAAGGRGRRALRRGRGAAAGGRGPVARLGAGPGGLVAADGERAQVGRTGRGGAARGPQGDPLLAARPGRGAGVGAGAGVREPAGDRGGGGLAARGTGRGGGGGGAAAGPGGPDPERGGRAGARCGGGG